MVARHSKSHVDMRVRMCVCGSGSKRLSAQGCSKQDVMGYPPKAPSIMRCTGACGPLQRPLCKAEPWAGPLCPTFCTHSLPPYLQLHVQLGQQTLCGPGHLLPSVQAGSLV